MKNVSKFIYMKVLLERMLIGFGIAHYKGYRYLVKATELVLEDPTRLKQRIQKDIYTPIAKEYETTVWAVERSLRTVIFAAWQNNPELMQHIIGRKIYASPTNSMFLEQFSIIAKNTANWLRNKREKKKQA